MKPGDHPEFFRFPAPEGRSRESTIVLDEHGKFWHDGAPVEKESMQLAFSQWLRRHPDNGRFILSNGYDWTYVAVRDVPFFVTSVEIEGSTDEPDARLMLSDASEEPLMPAGLRVGANNALYCRVKGGAYEARFSQSAQLSLAPLLVDTGRAGTIGLRLKGVVHEIPLSQGGKEGDSA